MRENTPYNGPLRLGLFAALPLAIMVIFGASPAAAQGLTVFEINFMLEEAQYDEADLAIAEWEAARPSDPETLYLRSRLLFFQGDYAQALEYADQAVLLADDPEHYMLGHRDLMASTWEQVAGYSEHRTADGRFIIRYDPAWDDVLIPMVEETLSGAYEMIGADFGYWPPEPVRVEIYPRTSTLAAVSSLSQEAIRNSGTIALCKYNRLMFTSPRALVRGYGWRDTLSHEYVHYVLQRMTGTRIPIWMHEGLAKFEEQRWRGDEDRDLPPGNQDLLARRVEDDNLITFEQMHPSMALLPTQEDTGTAFAEVYVAIEYLYEDFGIEGLRGVVHAIRDGADVEEAIEQVTGLTMARFISAWERHMRDRDYTRLPSDFVNSLQFMPESADEATPDELAGIAEDEAQNFIRLGQLLRARGRMEASIVEYRKAESLVGQDNPVWQNYLAAALLDLGRSQEAIDSLGQAAEFYPDFYLTFLNLGRAQLELGNTETAVALLIEAAGINPFDPEVHRQLSSAYDTLGETALAEQAREFANRTSR